ncbi:ATP-binding protein [Craurococcus roseus]|uniref:histidine kinase n=1 Tax=Craurococcus roseus TaxID=77585 RepID=A0ABN1EMQ3_9PROT
MVDPELLRRTNAQHKAAIRTLRRLRLALAASVAVPALLFAGAAWYDRAQLLRGLEDDARGAAAVLREHALKALETHELLVRQLDRRTQGMGWDEIRAASAALSAEMRAMHAGLPQVSALALTDAEGRQWAASLPLGPGGYVSVAHREFWSAQREADRGTFISRAYVGMTTQRSNFGISRRRTTSDGAFDGTVHVAVAASYFTGFWAEAARGQAGVAISLVRTDGEVLARFPEAAGALPRLPPQTSPLMLRLGQGLPGATYRSTSSIDGVERVFAYARAGDYPVVVGYGVPVASALAAWRQHLLALGAVCALAATALALAVLSAMRQARRLAAEQERRAAAEDTARQGQRLELLGQLAAGVAHDFANVAQAVQGGARLIEQNAGDPDRVRSLARMLDEAAGRGAALTRRMLDFARRDRGADGAGKDDAEPATDPAEAVSSVCQLLSRTLGAPHRLRCYMEAGGLPALVRGDRGELEAAVMNLAVNARDAMPGGGEVAVRAAPERVSGGAGRAGGAGRPPERLAPGLYARVSVSDTGVGLSPEALARAGEPFFTTKPRGRGTGLGLAMARGFAERAGGALAIETALGRGTTVTLWLPAAVAAAGGAPQPGGEWPPDGNVTRLRPASDRNPPPPPASAAT